MSLKLYIRCYTYFSFFLFSIAHSQNVDLNLILKLNPPLPASAINAEQAGKYVAQLGDINGDTYADWAILLPNAVNYETGKGYGRLFIYLGKQSIQKETPPDLIFESDSNGFGFGFALAAAGDVNGDGYDDFFVQRYNINQQTQVNDYHIALYLGSDFPDDEVDLIFNPNPDDLPLSFNVLSTVGDVNNDGYDDIMIGGPQVIGGTNAGHAYLFYGGLNMDNEADLIFTGSIDALSGAEQYAIELSAAGDVNGDNNADFLIGANDESVELYLGGPDLDNVPDFIFNNVAGNGVSPLPVPAGDINDDGFDDILIGMGLSGRFNLYFGSDAIDDTVDVRFTGIPSHYFGWDLSGNMDMNNDGYDDISASTSFNGNTYLSIFYGSSEMDSIADVVIYDPISGDRFGYNISSGGDINNDGYDDLVVGSTGNFNTIDIFDESGNIYIIPGGETISDSVEIKFSGASVGDYFGSGIDFIGDMNDDGYADLLIGSSNVNEGLDILGEAYLYFTGPQGDNRADAIFPIQNNGLDRYFGSLVSAAGDVNGDSIPDFLIAERNRAYLYYGTDNIDTVLDVTFQTTTQIKSLSELGDVNNDGFDDFLVCSAASGNGIAFLYLGGNFIVPTANYSYSVASINNFGESSSGARDLNGDGFDDFIVGSGTSNSAYIFFGDSSMDKNYDLHLSGENTADLFGSRVTGGRDLNGDGFNDIVVGAQGYEQNQGRAYVFFGGDSMDNIADMIISADSSEIYFGRLVRMIPDINADGFDEFVVAGLNRLFIYYGGSELNDQPDFIIPGRYNDMAVSQDIDGKINLAIADQTNSAAGYLRGRVWLYQNKNTIIINKIEPSANTVDKSILYQNYPNPFNPLTVINYNLPKNSRVELTVFNILGQKVKTLLSASQKAGLHQIEFNAAGLASGAYYYQLKTDNNHVQTKKLFLVK